ncbi:MAG: polymer-forming cytoskeletal protein [Deltaproteobacteria bacterium]|nr:polymer-forming cytoskeletal protein [Deltaproteobacteria bacterium]
MKRGFTCLLVLLILLGYTTAVHAEATSVVKINDDVTIEENVKVRNVFVLRGQITINGAVEQNVVAIGGSIVLTRTAVVNGDVIALGGIIVMGKGADVHGTLTEINSSNISAAISDLLSDDWEGWSWLFAIFSVVVFFAILILALLIVALIPKPIQVIAETIKKNTFKVSLTGLLGLLLIVPIAVLLTISVIGIVLIPLEMILVVSAALLGFIAVSQLVGRRVLMLIKRTGGGVIRQTFWGLITLWLIGWIPYVGWMIKVLAVVLGLGGVIMTRFGTKEV